MSTRLHLALVSLLAAAACTSESDDPDDTGFRVTVETVLTAAPDGAVSFVTPNATITSIDAADVRGKPFLVSIFEGGFSQGNDEPIEEAWGRVPDDLVITTELETRFEPGPYDASVIIYINTPVSDEDLASEDWDPVPPVGGDLSAFTLGTEDVLPGDPSFEAGVVRVNVIDGDVTKRLENRTPGDPDDPDDFLHAFFNTILLVP